MLRLLQKVRPKKREDTSFFDQLTYYYSATLILLFALLLSGKIYGPNSLECWLPAQLKDQWEKYAANLCHVEGTYFVGKNESFPMDIEVRKSRLLLYYQWVPFTLGGQMLLAMLPLVIWKSFSRKTGVPLTSIYHVLFNFESGTQDKIREMAEEISGRLKLAKARHITKLYLFFKLLNCATSAGQLLLLGHFLERDYSWGGTMLGWDLLSDLWKGRTWHYSGHFPRITYCDLELREQGGHMVRWTFQCLLNYNMLNEVFHIILWFWFVFVSLVSMADFLYWSVQVRLSKRVVKSIERDILATLNPTNGVCPPGCDCGHFEYFQSMLHAFLRDQTKGDGATLYEMIKLNCNKFRASMFIQAQWDLFSEEFQRNAEDISGS